MASEYSVEECKCKIASYNDRIAEIASQELEPINHYRRGEWLDRLDWFKYGLERWQQRLLVAERENKTVFTYKLHWQKHTTHRRYMFDLGEMDWLREQYYVKLHAGTLKKTTFAKKLELEQQAQLVDHQDAVANLQKGLWIQSIVFTFTSWNVLAKFSCEVRQQWLERNQAVQQVQSDLAMMRDVDAMYVDNYDERHEASFRGVY